jgi:hypothetical protein
MAPASFLCRPDEHIRTPEDTRMYIRAMTQAQLHSAVLGEFERSGMTQAELSRRTGISPDRISRLLAQPSNCTSNTLADLLFALTGGVISGAVEYPLKGPRRNYEKPAWLFPEKPMPNDATSAAGSSAQSVVLKVPQAHQGVVRA